MQKFFEYALHARIISQFIQEHFSEPTALSAWERLFWSVEVQNSDTNFAKEIKLTRIRTLTTILVVAGPTCLLLIIAAVAIEKLEGFHPWISLSGAFLCITYIIAALLSWKYIWTWSSDKNSTSIDAK